MSTDSKSTGSFRVYDARFTYSAPHVKAMKKADLPEAAFVGRSNVGKSTLLNALCSRKSIARTSKTPGRTQAVNFFEIAYRRERLQQDGTAAVTDGKACLADLPGFGFAKVSQGMRNQWQELIEQYLFQRESLNLLLLLIDCRREPGVEERWLADLGREGNLLVVLTKADKLSRNQLAKQRGLITKELGIEADRVFPTSLVGKAKGGVDELRDEILSRLRSDRE